MAWHTLYKLCPAICGGDGRGSKPAVAGEDQLSDPWAADEPLYPEVGAASSGQFAGQVVGVALCLMLWRVLPPQPEQDFYLSAGNLVKMQAALCHWAFGSMEYLWNGIDLKASSSLHSISLASSMLILRHLGSHWLWSTKNFCRGNTERFTWDHFLELYLPTCSFFPSKSNAWTRAIQYLETEASW